MNTCNADSDDLVILEEFLLKPDLSIVRMEPEEHNEDLYVPPRYIREGVFEPHILGEDSYEAGKAIRINFLKQVKSVVYREKFYGYYAFGFDGIMYPYIKENFEAVRTEVHKRYVRKLPPVSVPVFNPGGVIDDTPLARYEISGFKLNQKRSGT